MESNIVSICFVFFQPQTRQPNLIFIHVERSLSSNQNHQQEMDMDSVITQ